MNSERKRNVWKYLLYLLLILVILWFILVIYEYYRVSKDKRPLLCWGYKEVIEDDDEYALLCHGPLYKYKEYYYKLDKTMSARELTMFFTEFVRDTEKNHNFYQ